MRKKKLKRKNIGSKNMSARFKENKVERSFGKISSSLFLLLSLFLNLF